MRGAGALIFLALSGVVTPADGSVLTEPPEEVSVTVPAEGVRSAHLSVASSAGVDVTAGPAGMRDGALVVPVRIVESGSYLVAFHLVRADGRVEAGVTRFGVGIEPAGHSMAHAHSSDPLNLILTVIAAALVLASLYLLISRPRHPALHPKTRRHDPPSR
jgi:methionine-rich copper-binding protein CopC